MDETTMDYCDESSTMPDLVDLTERVDKDAIEFIKVENPLEPQLADEISLEDHLMNDANNSLEDDLRGYGTAYELEPSIKAKADFIFNFISAVRNMPVLWKKDTPGYKHPHVLQKAWNTLSQQFGISAHHLKEKWNLLRAQFRHNVITMEQKRAKGFSPEVCKPTWFAFEAMRFLKESSNAAVAAVEPGSPTAEAIKPVVVEKSVGAEELPKSSINMEELDSHDVVLELIERVKRSPILWDTSSANYKNKTVQTSEWFKIAKQMQYPVEAVKQKWQMLRSQFRSNINKMKHQSKSGNSGVMRPIWFGFDPMLFLLKGKSLECLNYSLKSKPVTTNPPVPKPIPVQQYVTRRVIVRPKATERHSKILLRKGSMNHEAKPPCTSPTVNGLPKAVRIIPHYSSSTSRGIPPFRSPFSVSQIDPLIVKTFQNLSQITEKIAQTETSPYSGLLSHLSSVLSRKRACDFNEIEGVLLNCLNELNQFPNAGNDNGHVMPRIAVTKYSAPADEEEEKESD